MISNPSRPGKDEPQTNLAAILSTSVQDHNNQYVRDLLKQSTEYCTKELLEELLIDTNVEPLRSSADLRSSRERASNTDCHMRGKGQRKGDLCNHKAAKRWL